MTPRAPCTAAGRSLLAARPIETETTSGRTLRSLDKELRKAILAIEAEAAAPAQPADAALREALKRLLANAEHIFDKKPVRDWTETLAEARVTLQAKRPTE
jgi:hypothetical protein